MEAGKILQPQGKHKERLGNREDSVWLKHRILVGRKVKQKAGIMS